MDEIYLVKEQEEEEKEQQRKKQSGNDRESLNDDVKAPEASGPGVNHFDNEVCEIEKTVPAHSDNGTVEAIIMISDSEDSESEEEEGEEEIERPTSTPLEVAEVEGVTSPPCILLDSDEEDGVHR